MIGTGRVCLWCGVHHDHNLHGVMIVACQTVPLIIKSKILFMIAKEQCKVRKYFVSIHAYKQSMGNPNCHFLPIPC